MLLEGLVADAYADEAVRLLVTTTLGNFTEVLLQFPVMVGDEELRNARILANSTRMLMAALTLVRSREIS